MVSRPPRSVSVVPTICDSFTAAVTDPISVSANGKILAFTDYLALPADARSGDEADVVDAQFTRNLLGWLGWTPGDWRYNTGKLHRPDYRVLTTGRTAFVIEDKSTSLDWNLGFVPQMRGYAKGTSGLVLWTNAKDLRLVRFQNDGGYLPVATVRVADILNGADPADAAVQGLHVIHDSLSKDRFVGFASMCSRAGADTERTRLDTETALADFIAGVQGVLAQVATSATLQIRAALETVSELRELEAVLLARFDDVADALLTGGGGLLEMPNCSLVG